MKFFKLILEFLTNLFSSKSRNEKKVDKKLLKARIDISSILPLDFKNNQKRLKEEYFELIHKNMNLHNMIIKLNDFTNKKFKKNIVITMIYRTQAEQNYLYRKSKKYAKKKFKSPHQYNHAVDIRSHTFTTTQINQIVAWLNKTYDRGNYYKWTGKHHTVGSGLHFHIQYVKK